MKKYITLETKISFLYVLLYAYSKNEYLFYIFFAFIFILEIKNLISKKYDKIIKQMILMIPLLGITTKNGIPIMNIYSAIFALYILFFEKKIGHTKKYLKFFIPFILFDLFKYLLFFNNISNILMFLSTFVFYLSIYSAVCSYEIILKDESKIDYYNAFVIGTFFSVIYGMINRFMVGGMALMFINQNIMTRNPGASGDPNYYGLYIAFSVCMVLNSKSTLKIKDYSIVLFLLFMGLTSSSRMYYVLVIVIMIFTLIKIIKNLFSRNIWKTLLIILTIIIGLFFIRNYIYENVRYLLNRLNDSDISNGRIELIQEYSSYLRSNIFQMFLGIGIPQYNTRIGATIYAHNLYIELYVTQGIIGIIIFFIILFKVIKSMKKFEIYRLLLLIIFLISGLAINYLEVECFYMLIVLMIINILYDINDKKTVINNTFSKNN